jgi:hypothetical protein
MKPARKFPRRKVQRILRDGGITPHEAAVMASEIEQIVREAQAIATLEALLALNARDRTT